MHAKFHCRYFFQWMVNKACDYEKSVTGVQIKLTAWGVLQLVVFLNLAIVLAVPLGVLGNLIKYFDRGSCLPQPVFLQQTGCGKSSQSLHSIKHRSTFPEVFCKKDVLQNFAIFTGKKLCNSFLLNKVAGLMPATLLKKDFGTGASLWVLWSFEEGLFS